MTGEESERERVHRIVAGVLRTWLVENEPVGGPVVPLRWLREEIHALIEARPYGDMRTAPAKAYAEALRDVLRLLQAAEKRQDPRSGSG